MPNHHQLSNQRLRLSLDLTNATLTIWTRSAGTEILQARDLPLLRLRHTADKAAQPLDGRIETSPTGFTFHAQGDRPAILAVELADNALRITLHEEIPALQGESKPARMRRCADLPLLQILPDLLRLPADEPGSGFVFPHGEGIWVDAESAEMHETLRLYENHGLTMPFWAMVRPGKGSLLAIGEHAYLQFLMWGDRESIGFIPELAADPDSRPIELEIKFLEAERPLAIAAEFRQADLARRHAPTLRQRAKDRPGLNSIIGGANVKFINVLHRVAGDGLNGNPNRPESLHQGCRFQDVADICRQMADDGIDRAMAIFWGFGAGGYDHLHPDILPANQWAGGDDALLEAGHAIKQLGFSVGGHENFQDIYQNAPSFGQGEVVGVQYDGSLQPGGFWAGGRCFILCSQTGLEFAKRNLPIEKRLYEWNALFIDTTTAAPLYECYSDAHPRTRWDDLADKIAQMDYACSLFSVFGSETGFSWGLGHMDYWEGILSPPPMTGYTFPRDSRRSLPLFAAVYRDRILAYAHQSRGLHPDHPMRFLNALRSAQPPYYFVRSPQEWQDTLRPYARKTYQVLAWLHRDTADELLVEHQWLTTDCLVERTALSDGTQIIINQHDNPYDATLAGLPVRINSFGFFVRSPRMIAFLADRAGPVRFDRPTWAVIRQDSDGRTLAFIDGQPADDPQLLDLLEIFRIK